MELFKFMQTTDKILVIDLEATCWENRPEYQRQHSEIIEIGVALLDVRTGTISKNLGILVEPYKSEISPFCTQLTTITPEMVTKEGVSLEDAYELLLDEYESHELTWASYGAYDKGMIERQSKKWSLHNPLTNKHINVKAEFAKTKKSKPMGMDRALKSIGIQLEGTHHRGVDDARNIAKILRWILNNN
ncbi:3'-5' exonuclease [Nonlabens xiamenensis]|uniref:3'-5' exonuclease n=1 Tax=Nonlabens xiamenensis TaxID=2341043 RepID=UPI001F0B98C8|nr:3'-5' exonuclease [Nonlabens xiamenensis]